MTTSIGSSARSGPPAPAAPALGPGQATAGHRRALVVIAFVVVAIMAIAATAVILTSRPAQTYPVGSPEAAFQGYLSAWQAGDIDAAYGFLSERARGSMSLDRYRTLSREYAWSREADRRVVLTDSTVAGSRATLDLQVEEFSSGGLLGGGDSWTWDTQVTLVRDGDAWHLDEILAGLETIWYEEPAEK